MVRVGMRAGCNNIMSSYELTPEGMKFGLGATTMMACPDPLMQAGTVVSKGVGIHSEFSQLKETLSTFLDAENTVLISATRA